MTEEEAIFLGFAQKDDNFATTAGVHVVEVPAVFRPDDREAAKHLVGFCERCDAWHEFESVDRAKGCPVHGTAWSNQQGLQITTRRTFVPGKTRRLTKKDSAA